MEKKYLDDTGTSIVIKKIKEHVNNDLIHIPDGGNSGQVLCKTDNGVAWKANNSSEGVIISYSISEPINLENNMTWIGSKGI